MIQTASELTDEDVARKVQAGEVDAFGVILQRYEKKMLNYARRFLFNHNDVEDLVQETFIKAFVNIQSFDASRRFSPWIYRIAHNQFVNAIKKKGREPMPLFDLDTLLPRLVAKERSDKEIDQQDARRMLDKCLDKLDFKYREPLILFYFEELSYQEISDILRIPIATVGVRLNRGKAMLKKLCQEFNQL